MAGRKLVGLRRLVLGSYVDPDLNALGLATPNPKEPTAFLRKAELVLDKLGGENLERMLGAPLFRSPHDPRAHREELGPSIETFRNVLDQLAKIRRRIDAALVRKREAAAEYDRFFLRTARMFEDLCRLAGNDALAERVRPSTRNPGRTKKKVGEDDDDLVGDDFPTETRGEDTAEGDDTQNGSATSDSTDQLIGTSYTPAPASVQTSPFSPPGGKGKDLEAMERGAGT